MAVVAAGLLLPASGISAAGPLDELTVGPMVGEAIPVDLTARDQNGEATTFDGLTGEEGLLLLFNRSVVW